MFEKTGPNFDPYGTIFVEKIMENSPVPAKIVDRITNGSGYTETVHFIFAGGEFFLEYSIANSLVSIPVRETKVDAPFGYGSLIMTKLEKVFVSSTGKDGKLYNIYNIYPTIRFDHPRGNLGQEFPRHGIQVAEPRP
jgi:hypothetical protein